MGRKRMVEMFTSQKEAQEIEIKQFQDITTIAEEGYQELYTDIHRQHDDTISTLKSELSTALKDNALLREKLANQVTAVQNEAERVRIGHEKQVQERCDSLIGQYRAIAEEATGQVG